VTRGVTRLRRRRVRGLALIVVLWAGALVTLLAASFAFSLRTEARLAGGIIDRASAGAAAEAGLARLMAVVATAQRGGPGAVTAEMTFEGMAVSLSVKPENARIDLNAAPAKLIEGLLGQALSSTGASASAEALTDAIMDWRDADDTRRPQGAEADEYEAAGVAVPPRNGPFLSITELGQVLGIEAPVFEYLKPLTSVYAWSPQVDAMSAERAVLLSLPNVSESQVDSFMQARGEESQGRGALSMLAGAGRYVARSGGRVYSLVARATAPSGVTASRRAVIKLGGRARQPISVLAWFQDVPRSDAGSAPDEGSAAGEALADDRDGGTRQ